MELIHLMTPVTHIYPPEVYKKSNVLMLCRSCIRNGVKLNMVGLGKPFTPYFKNHCILEFIKNMHDRDIVFIVDGYDMYLTCGYNELLDKFLMFDSPIALSVDTICYPDITLADRFRHYVNIGGIAGYVGDLIEALEKISVYEKKFTDENLTYNCIDQLAWQHYFLDREKDIALDYDFHIWQTLGGKPNMDELMVRKNGRFMNTKTGSFPCFIHGAGKVGMKALERLLG